MYTEMSPHHPHGLGGGDQCIHFLNKLNKMSRLTQKDFVHQPLPTLWGGERVGINFQKHHFARN